jgi:hypothetical protein
MDPLVNYNKKMKHPAQLGLKGQNAIQVYFSNYSATIIVIFSPSVIFEQG